MGTRSIPAIYMTLEIPAPHQQIRGNLTDGSVLEELLGRLYLPGWVQLVLGSHAQGKSRLARRTHTYYPLGGSCTGRGVVKVQPHCWCGNNRLTVLGFHGDSFTSICASENSRSLMGGSTLVNCVRLIIGCYNRWQGSWVQSAGWDCCALNSTIHYW